MRMLLSLVLGLFLLNACATQDKEIDNYVKNTEAKSKEQLLEMVKTKLSNEEKIDVKARDRFLKQVKAANAKDVELGKQSQKLFGLLIEQGNNPKFKLKDIRKTVEKIRKIEHQRADLKIEKIKGLKFLIHNKIENEKQKTLVNHMIQIESLQDVEYRNNYFQLTNPVQ